MQESDETDITKGKRQEGRCGMQYYLAIVLEHPADGMCLAD